MLTSENTARRLAEENEYAILATPWLLFPFERAYAMQGMETFLLNMAMDGDFARAFMEADRASTAKSSWGTFLASWATMSISSRSATISAPRKA